MHVLYSTDREYVEGWLVDNPDALSIDELVVSQERMMPILLRNLREKGIETSGCVSAAMLYAQMSRRFNGSLKKYATSIQKEVKNLVFASFEDSVAVEVTLLGFGHDNIQKCLIQLRYKTLTPA